MSITTNPAWGISLPGSFCVSFPAIHVEEDGSAIENPMPVSESIINNYSPYINCFPGPKPISQNPKTNLAKSRLYFHVAVLARDTYKKFLAFLTA